MWTARMCEQVTMMRRGVTYVVTGVEVDRDSVNMTQGTATLTELRLINPAHSSALADPSSSATSDAGR